MASPVKPVGDSFASFFTVKFLTYKEAVRVLNEEGKKEAQGAGSGGAATADVALTVDYGDRMRSYASSLEVVHAGDAMIVATVTFTPPFEDAIAIVDDQVIQRDTIMVLEWGWLASEGGEVITSELHLFVITQPRLEMSDGDYRVIITGTDLFGYAATSRDDRRRWSRATYPTDIQILREIVAKNRMDLDESGVVDALTINKARTEISRGSKVFDRHPLTEDEPDFVEQNEKDWTFFQTLCAGNTCSFYTIGKTVYLVDKDAARRALASYRLVYFRQPKSGANVNPPEMVMHSFSTNAEDTLFHPAASNGTTINHADLDGGKVVQTRIDPATDPGIQSLGARTGSGEDRWTGRVIATTTWGSPQFNMLIPRPAFTTTETGEVVSLPSNLVNRSEMGKLIPRAAHTWANTNAEATVPGAPGLVPMMLVRVECGSRMFSGLYLVTEVTHNLNFGGYETQVKLLREAASGDDEIGVGIAPANPNEEERREALEALNRLVPLTEEQEGLAARRLGPVRF